MTDVLVIGAGPAGVFAAHRAADLGARTTLVTREQFGGMAANDGPVPVRTLAHAARLMREARQLGRYGITTGDFRLDYPRLLDRVREVVHDIGTHAALRARVDGMGVARRRLTEGKARRDHDVVVATVPLDAAARPVIDGRTVGFCKLVVDRISHRILGCHVVGERAVEITQVAAVAMTAQLRVQDLARIHSPFPRTPPSWAGPPTSPPAAWAWARTRTDLGTSRPAEAVRSR
ncbi:FAD-dependent oxidoreductase [Nonomuraea sp. SMC257]|uniref:FAD-dependent oxidoreductase n=1 Tax=Nonomuraea montanisoli TaxID=2741721 RepID=A0A7Y6M6Q8_9ACTN|nr:FAD-dependent oxidoreductase [Nonomuraea montanisoli]NUW35539.1 FAD-dependent oxidoreductase [Nonomuraea montanisoli]